MSDPFVTSRRLTYLHNKYRKNNHYNSTPKQLAQLWEASKEKCACCGYEICMEQKGNCQANLDLNKMSWLCLRCYRLSLVYTAERLEDLYHYMKGTARSSWK